VYDAYSRQINYLRISVTDRCNLRCIYCRPEEGLELAPREKALTLEELHEAACIAVKMGMTKVRLTGGEPLVRKGIVGLVKRISAIDGLQDFSMTSNGTLMARFAKDLKAAGLQRVNISLDTMDPERFARVTRSGRLEDALAGIEAALVAGLTPVKVNCVIKESPEEPDARTVAAWGSKMGVEVRFIREMNLEAGHFWKVQGGSGGDCGSCGRLRLTSLGDVIPCLFSDLKFNVRELGIREAFDRAIAYKPESGKASQTNSFQRVGG